jgi:hypothetical protein
MRFPLMRSPISAPALYEPVHESNAWSFAANGWACLLALAFLLAGAFLLMFVLLCTLGALVERNCTASVGYYGCDTQQ